MRAKAVILRIAALAAVLAFFAGINAVIYVFVTGRCGNNYSAGSQPKMIDVGRYLPFEEDSELVRVETEVSLTRELPVLDGAAALVPVYAAFINAVYPEGCVTYEGGAFSDDNYYGENFAADSAMQYKNTVRGFTALVDGVTDVFFSTRPNAEQQAYADEQGAELVLVPIGLEAFVFFVNAQNPVDELTCDEIRDIYGGSILNWASVGGADRFIDPLTRVKGSGSQTAMDAFMKGRETARKPLTAIFGASIGYSFRYYMAGMVENGGVKMISLDGVYPSEENIRNGSYPLITPIYAVTRKGESNPNVQILLDWITGPQGQALVEKAGYAPLAAGVD